MEQNLKYIKELILLLKENPISHLSNSIEIDSIPQPFFTYCLIERVSNRLESLSILLKGNTKQLDFALNLVYRNILTDFFTTKFIFQNQENIEEQNNRIISLFRSGFNRTEKVQNCFKGNGLQKVKFNNELDESLLKEKFNSFQDLKEYQLPKTLDFIKTFKDCESSSYVEKTLKLWEYLSKYEHIGWSSYYTTRTYNNVGIPFEKEVLQYLRYSIEIVMISISNLEVEQVPLDTYELIKIYNEVLNILNVGKPKRV